MSEKLCALRKIGGGMSETVLWTNSAPSSTFSGQTITMLNSYTSFNYLKIRYKNTTSSNTYNEVIIPTDRLPRMEVTMEYRVGLGVFISSMIYFRSVNTTGNTSELNISNCARFNNSGLDNSNVIPLSIIGMK